MKISMRTAEEEITVSRSAESSVVDLSVEGNGMGYASLTPTEAWELGQTLRKAALDAGARAACRAITTQFRLRDGGRTP